MPIANYLGGAPPAVNSYSDSLQTADANNPNAGNLDGSKWIWAITAPPNSNTPLDTPNYTIGASSGGNALLWSPAGAANPAASCAAYLIPVTPYVALYSKTQFCQCTMVRTSGVAGQGTTFAGIAVMCNSANAQTWAYVFRVSSDDHHWQLARLGSATAQLTVGAANSVTDGDIFRLSADLSVAGQVTLNVNRNGVQLTNFVDNTANRLLLGSPALLSTSPAVGAGTPISDWRTFSCGAGT